MRDAFGGVVVRHAAAAHPVLAGATDRAVARPVNEAGQIAGTMSTARTLDATFPVVWEPNLTIRRLDSRGLATAINCAGDVAGRIGQTQPVVWRRSGAKVLLPVPANVTDYEARDIDDAGQVVGMINQYPNGPRAYRWNPSIGLHVLRRLPSGAQTDANAINASGVIAGSAVDRLGRKLAVLWRGDTISTILGLAPGSTASFATGINDLGQVVGSAYFPDRITRAWFWQPRTGFTMLHPTGATGSEALALTGGGIVAGSVASQYTRAGARWTLRTDADVPNMAPYADPGGPFPGSLSIFEGSPIKLDGTRSADPNGDPLTYLWELGDGTTATGATPTVRYLDDRAGGGSWTLRLTVRDPGGLTGTATTTVKIYNYRPYFTIPNVTLPAGARQYARTVTFVDKGLRDAPWTAVVTWGDGTTQTMSTSTISATGSGSFALSHLYAAPGTYSASMRITDADGGARTDAFTVTVQP